jgi:hypothetical protein
MNMGFPAVPPRATMAAEADEEVVMCCAKTSVSTASHRKQQAHEARRGAARAAGGLMAAFLVLLSPARADVVADWSKIALHTVVSSEQRPVHAAIEMAMVHVAMFETMNFIEGGYVPRFLVKPYRPVLVSSEAAAAAAAHYVLAQLHPQHKPALDAALLHSAAAIHDVQKKSGAMITGRALGGNIYAIWASDLSSAGAGASSKTSQASKRGSGASSVAWYWIVGQFIEAQRLSAIESARLYALVSMALSEVYGGRREAKDGSEQACAPCAAGTAIRFILESESGSGGNSGMTLTSASATGAAYASSRVREYARGLSLEQTADIDQNSIRAGEEMGRKIGSRTLANYKSLPVTVAQ